MRTDGDLTVGAAGAELLSAAEANASSRAELRELRAALSHIDAELGPLPLRALDEEHVQALVGSLRAAGLSPERERAIVSAVDALRSQRPTGPVDGPTPTDVMLVLGTRLATFASAGVFILFAGIVALAVVTLA
jgi:hypothetical protein